MTKEVPMTNDQRESYGLFLFLGLGWCGLMDECQALVGAEGVAEEVFLAVLFEEDADLAEAGVVFGFVGFALAGFNDDVGVGEDAEEHVVDEIDLGEEGDQEHAEDGGAKGGQEGPEEPVIFEVFAEGTGAPERDGGGGDEAVEADDSQEAVNH